MTRITFVNEFGGYNPSVPGGCWVAHRKSMKAMTESLLWLLNSSQRLHLWDLMPPILFINYIHCIHTLLYTTWIHNLNTQLDTLIFCCLTSSSISISLQPSFHGKVARNRTTDRIVFGIPMRKVVHCVDQKASACWRATGAARFTVLPILAARTRLQWGMFKTSWKQ